MKSEAARGILRIGANYTRLIINLGLGLEFMRFMLDWVGTSAVGLIGLLGAGTGVAAMFREITDRTVVRELGAAHHSGSEDTFRRAYNSALLISAGLALVVLVVFGVLYGLVPVLVNKDPELRDAARFMVITQGVFTAAVTLVSPIINMQVVTERFVRYNIWTIADRSSMLGGAVLVRYLLKTTDPSEALIQWSIAAASIQLVALSVPLIWLLTSDPRLRPRPAMADRSSASALFNTVRWYLAFAVSENLYERVGLFLTSNVLGLEANAVFYAAVSFVAYISQAAIGVSQGLEAVSARLESKGGRSLQALLLHATRLLGLVALPTAVVFFVLAKWLITLWIGKKIQNPDVNVPLIVTNVRILCLPLVVRAIAGGWTSILYGAGFLRRYAPMILVAALLNPIIMWVALKKEPSVYTVSAVFAGVYTFIYFGLLPRVAAACLEVKTRDLFTPLLRPALTTLICLPILLLAPPALDRLGVASLVLKALITGALFGAAYAGAAVMIVLDRSERQRFIWTPVRRLAGYPGRASP